MRILFALFTCLLLNGSVFAADTKDPDSQYYNRTVRTTTHRELSDGEQIVTIKCSDGTIWSHVLPPKISYLVFDFLEYVRSGKPINVLYSSHEGGYWIGNMKKGNDPLFAVSLSKRSLPHLPLIVSNQHLSQGSGYGIQKIALSDGSEWEVTLTQYDNLTEIYNHWMVDDHVIVTRSKNKFVLINVDAGYCENEFCIDERMGNYLDGDVRLVKPPVT